MASSLAPTNRTIGKMLALEALIECTELLSPDQPITWDALRNAGKDCGVDLPCASYLQKTKPPRWSTLVLAISKENGLTKVCNLYAQCLEQGMLALPESCAKDVLWGAAGSGSMVLLERMIPLVNFAGDTKVRFNLLWRALDATHDMLLPGYFERLLAMCVLHSPVAESPSSTFTTEKLLLFKAAEHKNASAITELLKAWYFPPESNVILGTVSSGTVHTVYSWAIQAGRPNIMQAVYNGLQKPAFAAHMLKVYYPSYVSLRFPKHIDVHLPRGLTQVHYEAVLLHFSMFPATTEMQNIPKQDIWPYFKALDTVDAVFAETFIRRLFTGLFDPIKFMAKVSKQFLATESTVHYADVFLDVLPKPILNREVLCLFLEIGTDSVLDRLFAEQPDVLRDFFNTGRPAEFQEFLRLKKPQLSMALLRRLVHVNGIDYTSLLASIVFNLSMRNTRNMQDFDVVRKACERLVEAAAQTSWHPSRKLRPYGIAAALEAGMGVPKEVVSVAWLYGESPHDGITAGLPLSIDTFLLINWSSNEWLCRNPVPTEWARLVEYAVSHSSSPQAIDDEQTHAVLQWCATHSGNPAVVAAVATKMAWPIQDIGCLLNAMCDAKKDDFMRGFQALLELAGYTKAKRQKFT